MKTSELEVGKVYAARTSRYNGYTPVLVLAADRYLLRREYGRVVLSEGAGQTGSKWTRAAVGVLVVKLDRTQLIEWAKEGKPAEEHPLVAAALEGAQFVRDNLPGRGQRTTFEQDEFPSSVHAEAPQNIRGEWTPAVTEEMEQDRQQREEREEEQRAMEARQKEFRLAQARLGQLGDYPSSAWIRYPYEEVGVPVHEYVALVNALAAARADQR